MCAENQATPFIAGLHDIDSCDLYFAGIELKPSTERLEVGFFSAPNEVGKEVLVFSLRRIHPMNFRIGEVIRHEKG